MQLKRTDSQRFLVILYNMVALIEAAARDVLL